MTPSPKRAEVVEPPARPAEDAPAPSKEGVHLWTVDEIERVILFCRENGVRTFAANGLDLSFERGTPGKTRAED